MQDDPNQLREVLEAQHGGRATVITTVEVTDRFDGQIAWQGVVHVFALEDHPLAKRAYAWSTLLDEATGKRRFYAVLQAGPVKSPADAVRAAMVSDHRGGRS